MSISSKTRKMLWGRSANRCAICRIELVMDETETDDESVIGDECHIIAREHDGPRGHSELTAEQRDKYSNLILLCKIHHKVIDDQPNEYSVEHLLLQKSQHEAWVRESLKIDERKQQDEEIYLTYIDKWVELSELNYWKAWTSWLLGAGNNEIAKDTYNNLQQLKEYIFSRVWPIRYPEVNASLENFRKVLEDLLAVFNEHCDEDQDRYYTPKFYKIREWDTARYHTLLKEYEFHNTLVQDLTLELTRAGNYVCDKVREFLLPSFRMNEGLLIVESGPYMDFGFRIYRPQYRDEERTLIPYPGLKEFKKNRTSRDVYFGIGLHADDPEFIKEWSR